MATSYPRKAGKSASLFMKAGADLDEAKRQVRTLIEEEAKSKLPKAKKDEKNHCGPYTYVDIKAFSDDPGRVVYCLEGDTLGREWYRDGTSGKIKLGAVTPVEVQYVSKTDPVEEAALSDIL